LQSLSRTILQIYERVEGSYFGATGRIFGAV
jgi:hypothetical protein